MQVHQSEKNKKLIIYILVIFYLFFLRMGFYIGQNSAGRLIYVIELLLVVAGIAVFLFARKRILPHHIWLFSFCAIAMVTTFLFNFTGYSYDKVDTLVSIWFFFSILMMGNYLTRDSVNVQLVSKIAIFAAIIYSFMYYTRVLNAGQFVDEAAAINSVYFAVLLLPFVLLQNKMLYKIAGIIVIVLITLISNKRAAFIAVAVFFVFYLMSTTKNGKKNTAVNLILVLLFAVILVLSVSELGLFSQMEIFSNLSNMFEDGGSGRADIYSSVWNLIKQFSFEELLFGRGFSSVSASVVETSAHNDFLEILYDYGIFGIWFYISFIISICRYASKHLSTEYKPIFNGSIGMFLVISLFSHLIIYKTQIAYFAILWSLLINTIPRGEKDESSPYQLR